MPLDISIVGAAGFVGTNLALAALEAGHNVTLIDVSDRLGRLRLSGLLERAPHQFVNLAEPGARIVSAADVVIHLAALPQVDFSVYEPARVMTNNTAVMAAVLDSARALEVPVLFASSIEVYGGNDGALFAEASPMLPLSPYAASKIGCEEYLKSFRQSFGIEATTVRLTNLYGPWQAPDRIIPRITTQALSGIKSEVVTGRLRDFLAVEDATRALLGLVERGLWGDTFNLSVGVPTGLEEVADTIAELTASGPVARVDCPAKDGRGPSLVASPEHLEQQLGWQARVELSDGLGSTVSWYAENNFWWQPFQPQFSSDRNGPQFLLDHAFPFWVA
ncbi:NAD-dependent epimerase/dehydratase family protein [Streptomyces sp. NPDC088260]|uniref:NAD-dependent epimerase/dehydratase family protein n=1 Tax=Streptomyces sp. NPDC088260 TaxID=3365850 RepID=UPI0037F3768B